MAKVITTKRLAGDIDKAHDYIRTHVLFPSSLLGLIAMVVGVLGLLYQLIMGTYGWETFSFSSGLLLIGVLLGWGVTKYQKFILREYPTFFSSRMRSGAQRSFRKMKKSTPEISIDHRGRGLIPLFYLLGILMFIGLSIACIYSGALDGIPAFALPWAGFFWAKMFFWKGVIATPSKVKKGGK